MGGEGGGEDGGSSKHNTYHATYLFYISIIEYNKNQPCFRPAGSNLVSNKLNENLNLLLQTWDNEEKGKCVSLNIASYIRNIKYSRTTM